MKSSVKFHFNTKVMKTQACWNTPVKLSEIYGKINGDPIVFSGAGDSLVPTGLHQV